jgi:hypothetical protein
MQAAGCPEKLVELQLSNAALRHSLIILRRNLVASAYSTYLWSFVRSLYILLAVTVEPCRERR